MLLVDVEAGADDPSSTAEWARAVARPGGLVVVIHRSGEAERAVELASAISAAHVVELPTAAAWLQARLRPLDPTPVLAVVGAVGGVGASTVAIACAAGAGPGCLLVDADPRSPGLDLPLGVADGEGARWSAFPDSSEPLVSESVRAALPIVEGISLLTGSLPEPFGNRVTSVLDVGRRAFPRVVLDCGRDIGTAALAGGDAAVVVVPATLAGVVSARRVLDELATSGISTDRIVLALRPSGWLPREQVVGHLGDLACVEVPKLPRIGELADCGDLLSGRTGHRLRRLGAALWEAVG